MADYTTDSPAMVICAAQYAPIVGTVTAIRQVNGITFVDVTYLAQAGATCSVALRIADGATDEEIQTEIDAYGVQWYTALRWQAADAGAWSSGLQSLINTKCAPQFPPEY